MLAFELQGAQQVSLGLPQLLQALVAGAACVEEDPVHRLRLADEGDGFVIIAHCFPVALVLAHDVAKGFQRPDIARMPARQVLKQCLGVGNAVQAIEVHRLADIDDDLDRCAFADAVVGLVGGVIALRRLLRVGHRE